MSWARKVDMVVVLSTYERLEWGGRVSVRAGWVVCGCGKYGRRPSGHSGRVRKKEKPSTSSLSFVRSCIFDAICQWEWYINFNGLPQTPIAHTQYIVHTCGIFTYARQKLVNFRRAFYIHSDDNEDEDESMALHITAYNYVSKCSPRLFSRSHIVMPLLVLALLLLLMLMLACS